MLKSYIQKVSDREFLSREEASQAMTEMLTDDTSDVHRAAFLTALRTRGETAEELAGFLTALRSRMKRVTCQDENAVDVCGTGGDGSNSFNLSTASALVAAAGGVTVAKHGNRAISSRSGSADFLQALGVPIDGTDTQAETALADDKFAFLFAPNFHPAMKAVAPVRRALGMRTAFNLLGPLANPAGVKRQLVGVFHGQWLEPVTRTLAQTGSVHVLSVHGEGGLDEISACGNTDICEYRDGTIERKRLQPEEIGVSRSSRDAIAGGSAEENVVRFLRMANGHESELREWVVANAAPAFYLAGQAESLPEGATLARDVIVSGTLAMYLSTLRNGSASA